MRCGRFCGSVVLLCSVGLSPSKKKMGEKAILVFPRIRINTVYLAVPNMSLILWGSLQKAIRVVGNNGEFVVIEL